MTPNDDNSRTAAEIDLINAIINSYHTTRLADLPVGKHILGKGYVRCRLNDLLLAAERRGIERAAQVADEHACQHCAHIPAAIRSLTEGA